MTGQRPAWKLDLQPGQGSEGTQELPREGEPRSYLPMDLPGPD